MNLRQNLSRNYQKFTNLYKEKWLYLKIVLNKILLEILMMKTKSLNVKSSIKF